MTNDTRAAAEPATVAETVTLTRAAGAWLNSVVAFMVSTMAAASRIIPDFHVGVTANPKGPRLRVRNKDGSLGSLKLPCYLISPLSGETADALAIDRKTGEPDSTKKRTLKVAPRYTLDGTCRGLIDIACASDTSDAQELSERFFALIANLAASVACQPRCTTNLSKGKAVSKMISRPEGWKTEARKVHLDVDSESSTGYTLTDVGLQAARAFIAEHGTFPLSGLGALDTAKDDRPKVWAEAVSAATGLPLLDKQGKPYKIRIPNDVRIMLESTGPDGFIAVRLYLKTDAAVAASEPVSAGSPAPDAPEPAAPEPEPVSVATVATDVTPKSTPRRSRKVPTADAPTVAEQATA